MQDVSFDLENATLTPEEGARSIKDAATINVEPDLYDEMKVELKPLVDERKRPPMATPGVAETMSKGGRTVASVMKPDLERMNYVEKQVEFTKRKLDAGDTIRRRSLS